MGIMKNRCVIVGGGDCSNELLGLINAQDFVICADGGYDKLSGSTVKPDLIIGDFDSIFEIPDFDSIIKLPIEKDITDTEASLIEGINRGYTSFLLLGGTGGRFEHTFANISLMARCANENIDFQIIDEKHHFYSVHNSKINIRYISNQQISVFAFGGIAEKVSIKGVHYPLDNYTLDPFIPLGISNDITEEFCEIAVDNGTLIIIETLL